MNNWISVEDSLPENKHVVLVYNKWNEMAVCKMDKNVNNFIFMLNDTSLQIKDVTHWMPLPELPEKDE